MQNTEQALYKTIHPHITMVEMTTSREVHIHSLPSGDSELLQEVVPEFTSLVNTEIWAHRIVVHGSPLRDVLWEWIAIIEERNFVLE